MTIQIASPILVARTSNTCGSPKTRLDDRRQPCPHAGESGSFGGALDLDVEALPGVELQRLLDVGFELERRIHRRQPDLDADVVLEPVGHRDREPPRCARQRDEVGTVIVTDSVLAA